MSYSDLILANGPVAYYRLGEASGTTAPDSSGNGQDGSYVGSPTLGAPSLLATDPDTAVTFTNSAQSVTLPAGLFSAPTQITARAIIKRGAATGNTEYIVSLEQGVALYLWVDGSSGKIAGSAILATSGFSGAVMSTAAPAVGDVVSVTLEWVKGSRLSLYINGVLNDEITGLADELLDARTAGNVIANGASGNWYSGTVDEVALFAATLGGTEIAKLDNAALGIADAQSIPVALHGTVTAPSQAVPVALAGHVDTGAQVVALRLLGQTATAGQSVPLSLSAVAEAAVAGPAVRWGIAVSLGGTDISAQLVNAVRIGSREQQSATASLSFLPAAGAIAPEQYENRALVIDWLLLDGSGVEQARFRRFTGVVELAEYDPDAGVVQLSATNDLQGRVEVLPRATIAARVGGQWSRHVFDDTADGWQYAQDRLSTQEAEFHISSHGALVVVPWAAKGAPDITITDDGRFSDTVRLQRATRRELVTRYTINLDFRFTRLRHREVGIKLVDIDFCRYLHDNFELPAKGMVEGAAGGGSWTQIGDIAFTELPPSGTYCLGRNWQNTTTDDDFCLGASWKVARRWAQTVTEQYVLEVTAPDLAESVGDQVTSADYGIEATYDATEYERNTDFSGPPLGATLDPVLADYVEEATGAEQDGRTAMEAAQQCALAVGRGEILGRARRTRLTVGCVYRPDMDLASTVRVQSTYLTAQGKVAAIQETLDPTTGALGMTITLALSRHGGSGLAADTPLDPSARPDVATETPTARTHALGLRLGQTATSPPDNGDADGYFANVPTNGDSYDAAGPTYQRRLVVNYPEIEQAARQAVAAAITTAYTVAVPEDTLIMEA